ncbi:MAG: HEAT repeat domain-containing protein [Chloroflexota bacterium]
MDYQALLHRFTTSDEITCEQTAISLGENQTDGLQVLTQLMAEPVVDLRFWAIRGLWAHGSPEAIAQIINALQDEDEMIRSGAAVALGEMNAEIAVKALGHALMNDATPSGDHATDALSKMGQVAAPPLIEALAHQAVWARRRAAKALIPVESKKAIPALFNVLDDESYMVRHYAETALARMGVGQMVYFQV